MQEGHYEADQSHTPSATHATLDSASVLQANEDEHTSVGVVSTSTTAEPDIKKTPELESLSSGSEAEDDFYEAPEEVVGPSEDVEHIADAKSEEKGQTKLLNVEVDIDEGVLDHDSSRDSVEKEFIMVNYPTSNEPSTRPVPVSTAPCSAGSGEEGDMNTQHSTDTVLSTVEKDDQESQKLEMSGASNQAGFADSGQNLATNSQVMTEQIGEGDTTERREVRSEVAVEKKLSQEEEDRGNMNIPSFESLGLLYAKSSNVKDNRYFICMPILLFN